MSTRKPAAPATAALRTRRPGAVPPSTPGASTSADAPRQRVGVIGLGIMGSAMAHNLRRDGFEVTVVDRAQAGAGDEEQRELNLFANLAEVGVKDLEGMALKDYTRLQTGYFRLVQDDEL